MTTGYQIEHPDHMYFLTFQVVDWVDIFSRKIYRDIILDSFSYCRKEKGLNVWAYVIMTNHIHCILSANHGNLPDILRDFKRFTATKIIKEINSDHESRRDWMLKRFEFSARRSERNSLHQFWIHDNHAVELNTDRFIRQKLIYIHNNPVKAGWVDNPEDWLYSSARNYACKSSLMDIDILDISFAG